MAAKKDISDKPAWAKGAGQRVTKEAREVISHQLAEIGRMLSRGQTEYEIRCELGMSRKNFDRRMEMLKRASLTIDCTMIWARFKTSMDAHKRRLFTVYQIALEAAPQVTPASTAAERNRRLEAAKAANGIVMNMAEIDECVIRIGQTMGVYDQVPTKLDLTNSDGSLANIFQAPKPEDWTEEQDAALEKSLEAPVQVLHS